jgi:ClpX C4-type zinc finger protein
MSQERCSFCHKPVGSVERLIRAPLGYGDVSICIDCVRVCVDILGEDGIEIAPIIKETGWHWLLRKLTRAGTLQQMQ